MRNGDYIKAKQDIDNNICISKHTFNEMKEMKKEFDDYIKMLTAKGDIKQAIYMKNTSDEIGSYIERSRIP